MADAGWACRVFVPNDYTPQGTVGIFSNFKQWGNRQNDNLTIFCGMYGLDNYLLWEMDRDIPSFDFSSLAIEVKLFLHKNNRMLYFNDVFRVPNPPTFNSKTKQYEIYAISEDSLRLQTKLIKWGVSSVEITGTEQMTDVTGELLPQPIIILKKLLEKYNIFMVFFHKDFSDNINALHKKYPSFTVEKDWTVFDLINYIAMDNGYEWFVKNRELHIGHEVMADRVKNCGKPYDPQTDNLTHGRFFMRNETIPSPASLMCHYQEQKRCVWFIQKAGARGGKTIYCFAPISSGTIKKDIYENSLEGEIEKNNAADILHRNKLFSTAILGTIVKDDGLEAEIDEIAVERDVTDLATSLPHLQKFNSGRTIELTQVKKRVSRWSPYLDHRAGILFPSQRLADFPPNSLLINVKGRDEEHLQAGMVFGPDIVIPVKGDKLDFRLQFPNGWCLYVDKDGVTYLQPDGTPPSSVPTGDDSKVHILLHPDGHIVINKDENTYITIEENGEINIKAEGDINVDCVNAKVSASTKAEVDAPTVDIGASANAVNIAGGAKALAHAQHTHTETMAHTHTVLALPGLIPQPTGPAIGTDTINPCTDNTTKTKAD